MVSYTSESVTARLIQLGRESREHPSPVRIDMSPAGVTSRLEMLSALSELCGVLSRSLSSERLRRA